MWWGQSPSPPHSLPPLPYPKLETAPRGCLLPGITGPTCFPELRAHFLLEWSSKEEKRVHLHHILGFKPLQPAATPAHWIGMNGSQQSGLTRVWLPSFSFLLFKRSFLDQIFMVSCRDSVFKTALDRVQRPGFQFYLCYFSCVTIGSPCPPLGFTLPTYEKKEFGVDDLSGSFLRDHLLPAFTRTTCRHPHLGGNTP